jgi:hypothetical protein
MQLKRFNVGSKMAITASAPILPNQKNNLIKSPDSLTHPVQTAITFSSIVL